MPDISLQKQAEQVGRDRRRRVVGGSSGNPQGSLPEHEDLLMFSLQKQQKNHGRVLGAVPAAVLSY